MINIDEIMLLSELFEYLYPQTNNKRPTETAKEFRPDGFIFVCFRHLVSYVNSRL